MEPTIPLSKHKKLQEEHNQLKEKCLKFEYELDWLKRQVFGSKSERNIPDESQLTLDLDVNSQEVEIQKEDITYTRTKIKKKPGHSRSIMPTHLPFEDETIEPDENVTGLKKIGEEISWVYKYKPGSLVVKRTIRPKYEKPNNEGVIIASIPSRAIDKGNFDASFMAQVTIDKFLYHMPLYRQIQKFKNEYSTEFAESTFCDIISKTAFWLEPIYEIFKKDIQNSTYLQVDETKMPVLIKAKKGKAHKGFYWVYYDPLKKIVLFDYQRTRKQEHPFEFLRSFEGTIQIDGYAGYNKVVNRSDISRGACMDHVRRYFKKALEFDKNKAQYALDRIKVWYGYEQEARDGNYTFEQRLFMRQEKVKELMADFKQWMLDQAQEELPSSAIRKACNYGLGQWNGFDPYLTDGRIELSNILVENCIRPIAIGRKNYLFKGSESAAKRSAMIYSIIATAHFHEKNPSEYIAMLLKKLPETKQTDIKKFLPY